MSVMLPLRQMLARAALPAVCLLVGGYFAFHAFNGPTGYGAWRGYQMQHAKLSAAKHAGEEQKLALQRQLALLDPRAVNPDLADELVRRHTHMIRPDELVVPMPVAPAPADTPEAR